MTRTEPELRGQLDLAARMPMGEGQQAAMQDVIRHADAGGLPRLAFDARRKLANAYCVDRQWDKAFPLFSRCLSDYDRRPGDFSPEEELELREWYVFIISTMAEFPEVSLDQIYGALADVEQRFKAGGHSLRTVHAMRRWVAMLTGDWNEEERCYRLWHAAGGPAPGNVWDFEVEIERLILRGDDASRARALTLAAPVLAGQLSFTQSAAPILCLMLIPLAQAGQFPLAAVCYQRARRDLFSSGPFRYEYSGMLHEFCALTGNAYQGLADMRLRLRGFYTLNRPNGKMEYAASLAVLCRSLNAAGGGGIRVNGPGPGYPVLIAALAGDAWHVAMDLAARFDQRNRTPWQGNRIRARLAAPPVVSYLPLPPTGPQAAVPPSRGYRPWWWPR